MDGWGLDEVKYMVCCYVSWYDLFLMVFCLVYVVLVLCLLGYLLG
jgi:hypothetical protein